jgi:hypothetical protein
VQKRWPFVEDYIRFHHHFGNFETLKYDVPVSYYDQLKVAVNAEGYKEGFLLPE